MTHNDAVLSDLNVVTYGGGFDHTACPDVDVVTNFHRIVVEVSSVSFVRRSKKNSTYSP